MIAVNMHEAKSRLSELVKVVETTGEAVVLCRNGDAVAEIRPLARRRLDRCRIKPRSGLKVTMARGFDPSEPLAADEWPPEFR